MAQRKAPETKALGPAAPPNVKAQVELPNSELNTVLRGVKKSTIEQANNLRQKTFDTLRRLGVPRDISKAAKGVPAGSDQIDYQTIFRWMDKIEVGNKAAIKQLVAIDATAVARSA